MKDRQPSDPVLLGKIGAAFGIKGWVKLNSFTEPEENILDYRHFFIARPSKYHGKPDIADHSGNLSNKSNKSNITNIDSGQTYRCIEIDNSKQQNKGLVAHIVGCDDRDTAQTYTGFELLIDKSELPALDEETYYWHQLEGMTVKNTSGEVLGKVDHLLETGANDVLVVRDTEESIDDRERLIPYITARLGNQFGDEFGENRQVIIKVDQKAQYILVNWDKDF